MMKMPKDYSIIDFPPLTDEQKAELDILETMSDDEIDFSDIPEQTTEDFARGQFYYAKALKIPKENIHTKIDVDTLEWLKQGGKGYQTRLNAVLRWARMNGCPISLL